MLFNLSILYLYKLDFLFTFFCFDEINDQLEFSPDINFFEYFYGDVSIILNISLNRLLLFFLCFI
jgi:hypothetical protein